MRLDLVFAGVIALGALQIACGQKPSEYMMGQPYTYRVTHLVDENLLLT